MPHFRYFGALALALFSLAGACLTALLLPCHYNEAKALENIIYHDEGVATLTIQATPASFALLKTLAAGVFVVAVLLLGIFWKKGISEELGLLRKETKNAVRELLNLSASLSLLQKITAYLVLAVLVALRTIFSFTDAPDVDEIASFNDFIKNGALAVAAYYPVPNNHVFSNLIAFLAYQFHPDFWFAMRLPTLLISTAGTVVLFLVLLRFSNFTIALLGIGLWGLSGMGLYYGYAGRGYALFSFFAVVGFFALYGVSLSNHYSRLLWALLILTSALGFYTVPAFLYSFLSLCVLAFFYWLGKGGFAKIQGLLISGLLVVALTLFLYLPVLVVCGLNAIVGNSYVVSMSWEKVIGEFYTHTQIVESSLLGIADRGLTVVAMVLLCFLVYAVSKARKTPQSLALGIAACLLVSLPFLWVLLQRVQPPSRIFFYKSFFLFLVAAILLNWLFAFIKPGRKITVLASVLLLAIYGITQGLAMNTRIVQGHQDAKRAKAIIAFVMNEKPESILITRPWYSFYFLHYVKPEFPELVLHNKPAQGQIYSCILTSPKEQLTVLGIDSASYDLRFSNKRIKVYFHRAQQACIPSFPCLLN